MKPTISIFGNFQNGKSTLINCLLGLDIAKVGGTGLAVTRNSIRYTYDRIFRYAVRASDGSEKGIIGENELDTINSNDELVVYFPSQILQHFDIVDTPGYNACEKDTLVADSIISQTDFAILLVHNKGLSQDERMISKKLSSYGIPFVVVMNCYYDIFNHWNPLDTGNLNIYNNILSDLSYSSSTLLPNGIFVTNLIWYWLSLQESRDSISNNMSIARSLRLLKIYWKDLALESYSSNALALNSQFDKFKRFLCSRKFYRYIYSLKINNEAIFKISDIAERYISHQRNYLNDKLKEKQKSYHESQLCFKKKLLSEIMQIEKNQTVTKNDIKADTSIALSFFPFSRKNSF